MAEPLRGSFATGIAAAGLAALMLSGCASGVEDAGSGYTASQLSDPWTVPSPELSDTDGTAYSLTKSTTKPVTLVFFGYTNCPDICGMVMGNIASALARLNEDQRDKVEVAFVTTDPARDDGSALRTYLDRYDESFVGLTAPMPQILEAGNAFHVAIDKGKKLPSGGYDVTHGTQVFLLDSDDEIPMFWGQDTSPADLSSDLTTLLKAES
ncbi:MAG: SCO family protein [Nocardioides sp.]|nr:SCO family protein [Nocardioides sp.]